MHQYEIRSRLLHFQGGATLVVGMIMLAIISVMVATSFALSRSNLGAVGNMQFRNQALAAANKAIEQVVSSAFTAAPVAQTLNIDLNNDGNTDYVVSFAVPTCVRATQAGTATLSSISLGSAMSTSSTWNTVWEIDAAVTDPISGASVSVKSGIRVLLTQSQKDIACP